MRIGCHHHLSLSSLIPLIIVKTFPFLSQDDDVLILLAYTHPPHYLFYLYKKRETSEVQFGDDKRIHIQFPTEQDLNLKRLTFTLVGHSLSDLVHQLLHSQQIEFSPASLCGKDPRIKRCIEIIHGGENID